MSLPELSPPKPRDANNSAATDVSLLENELRSSFVQMVVNTLGGERTSSFTENEKELGFVIGEKPAPDEPTLPVLSKIGGRFTVQKTIGRGGFGAVYLAHDEALDRDVAIKVPHEKLRSDPQLSSLCLKEARLAARLHHPSIVTIFDISEDEGRIAHIVQEFVRGATLYELLSQQRFSVKQTILLVMKVAEAIAFAHARGVYHRDLKPANLIVDESGGIRVLDFGLAVDEEMQRGARGQVAGTIAYMSPEQIEGRTHHLDGRTDIWSLGVIFYELLTGRRPFRGTTNEISDQVIHREAAPPRQFMPSIPKKVEACCLKCLSKSVSTRYATALDLLEDLKEIVETESLSEDLPSVPIPAPPKHDTKKLGTDTTRDVSKASQGKRPFLWIACGLFIVLSVTVVWSLIRPGDQNQNRQTRAEAPSARKEGEAASIAAAKNGESTQKRDGIETDLLNPSWMKIIGAESTSDVSYGEAKLTMLSIGDCAVLFDPPAISPRYEIQLEVRQVPWSGTTGLLFGASNSGTDSSKWLSYMLLLRPSSAKRKDWTLQFCHAVISTQNHAVEQLIEIGEEITLPEQKEQNLTIKVTIENGSFWSCNVGDFFSLKSAFQRSRPSESAAASALDHKLPTSGMNGRAGIFISNTNATVLRAALVDYK